MCVCLSNMHTYNKITTHSVSSMLPPEQIFMPSNKAHTYIEALLHTKIVCYTVFDTVTPIPQMTPLVIITISHKRKEVDGVIPEVDGVCH